MAEACLPGRPADSCQLGGDPSLFLSRVWEMCQGDGPFCDLQLQFGDETRQGGNSLVLAALSPFFEAMLTTEMKERAGHVVQLPTISQSTFRQVLAFSLGREVEEREEELVELLQAADMLQLWPLKDACGQALIDRLTQDNCLDTLQLVHKFSLHKFVGRVEKYTSACLDQVYKGHTWVSLKEAEVSGVIRARGLCDSSTDTKAAAVLRWLQENQAEGDTTGRLLGLLSLEQLSFDFMLDFMLPHSCVLQCPSVLQAVKECMRTKAAAGTKQEPTTALAMQARVTYNPDPVSYVFIFNNGKDRLEVCEWLVGEQVLANHLQRDECLLSSAPKACSGQLVLAVKYQTHWGSYTAVLHFSMKERRISGPRTDVSCLSHLAGAVDDSVFSTDGKNISKHNISEKKGSNVGNIWVQVSDPGVAIMGDFVVVVGGRGYNNQNNLIQTFHTKTNQAFVSVDRLPSDMTRVKFAGHHQGRAYFLGNSGDLVGLVERHGEVVMDFHVQLEDLKLPVFGDFSVSVADNLITVCADQFLHTFLFSGQRRRRSHLPSLPKRMDNCCMIPM